MTPSRLRLLAATAALAALALTGCTSAAPTVVGSWGDSSQTDTPSLDFTKDGKVTGTDGCNRLMGGFSEHAGVVTFEQMASTMMFCEGVDTWLSKAATAKLSGDTLTVSDESGAEIGTLKRAKN